MRHIFTSLIAGLVVMFLPVSPGGNFNIHAQDEGFLVLNEISPMPSDGAVWVELLNPTNHRVSLDGWTIEFFSGFSFTFPDNSGDVEGNGLHVLEITGENPLDSDGDGCILKNQSDIVDQITWGYPDTEKFTGVSCGSPLRPIVGVIDDSGMFHPDDVCIRVPSNYTQGGWIGSEHWAYRRGESASKGRANPYPAPLIICPSDGAIVGSGISLVVIDYEWSDGITFQVARDTGFRDIVIEENVEDNYLDVDEIGPGTYYWRVRADNSTSWTGYAEFTRAPFNVDDLVNAYNASKSSSNTGKGGQNLPDMSYDSTCIASHIIPCPYIQQNKDSAMLCLDGCNMIGPCAWCDIHAATQNSSGFRYDCQHGRYNCARACLAMIASTGGCTLSQDRISYYIFEESGAGNKNTNGVGYLGDPRGDLSHRGTARGSVPGILNWLYRFNGLETDPNSAYNANYSPNLFDDGDRNDMDSIREFIDDNRPAMRSSGQHATLINGYAVIRDTNAIDSNWILVQNPAASHGDQWFTLESTKGVFWSFSFPPKTGNPSRNDELEMDIDTDGDGIFDFDETYRFNTLPGDVDTDGDNVHDMEDIVGYVFEPDGLWSPFDPDIDNDGARKESDPDNDRPLNDGVSDGCEDANHNGFFDPGGQESHCFNSADDFTVSNPDCFFGWIRWYATTNICDDPSYEEIILREGVMNTDEFVHSYSYDLYMCTKSEMNGETYFYMEGHAQGTGDARVTLTPDAEGNYFIDMDTQPSEATMYFESSGLGTQSASTMTVPLFLTQLEIPAYKIGKPETTPDGGIVLRGVIDLFGIEYAYDPTMFDITDEELIQEHEQAIQSAEGVCTLEWEIWLQAPTS